MTSTVIVLLVLGIILVNNKQRLEHVLAHTHTQTQTNARMHAHNSDTECLTLPEAISV